MRNSLLGVFLFSVGATAMAAEPYRFGPLGPSLPAEDLAAIAKEAGEVPWALFGRYSPVLPEVRYVDAFLSPNLSTDKLRRGPFIHMQCTPRMDAGPCGEWTMDATRGAYGQVADGPLALSAHPSVRTARERPMRVIGSLSDDELFTLVAYVRSSPRPRSRDGVEGMSIGGTDPILEVQRERADSVIVFLSVDGGSGQTAEITQTRHGWRVARVTGWIVQSPLLQLRMAGVMRVHGR